MRRFREIALLAVLFVVLGCGERDIPGLLNDWTSDAGAPDRFIPDDADPNQRPPAQDAGGFCGHEIIPTLFDPPTLYFVLDRSGSMSDAVEGLTKYTALEIAIVDLVRHIGARARIGAAAFPAAHPESSCQPGVEVFPVTTGDPASFIDTGKDGPVTTAFAGAIHLAPRGGTPTGATLEELLPHLSNIDGKTYVILATDGGPNCNPDAKCSALNCIPNIENLPGCSGDRNCCTAETYGSLNCLDAGRTVRAVEALATAGITSYIIGLPGGPDDPGTEIYGWLLDEMAIAGGAAREGSPKYFAIDVMSELRSVLAAIGAEIIATCDYTLAEAPEDPGKVNVYFDHDVIVQDEGDGWYWTGPTSISLAGKACERVKSGAVGQVHIVVGCPTEKPR